jgi:hypothetical protein
MQSYVRTVLEWPGLLGSTSVQRLQEQAQIATGLTTASQGLIKPCAIGTPLNSNNPTGGEREDCLTKALEKIQASLTYYIDEYPASFGFPWAEERLREINELIPKVRGTEPFDADSVIAEPSSPYSWLIGPPYRSEFQDASVFSQLSFRQLLEAAHVLAGLGGPLALALSLLPIPIANRAIVIWFSGFMGIGLAKIFFNLIIGIAAGTMLRASPPIADVSWFSNFMAYGAPTLAISLATGGGFAVLNGLQGLTQAFVSRGSPVN